MGVDAAAVDRLPWLADEVPAKRRRGRGLLWAIAAVAVVGGLIWIGARRSPEKASRQVGGSTTVLLPPLQAPAPKAEAPARKVAIPPTTHAPPAATARPAPAKEAVATTPVPRSHVHETVKPKHSTAAGASPAKPKSATPPHKAPKDEAPKVATGPAGRVIEIGAFGSAEQAKRAWASTLSAHPALGDLAAKPTESRNSHGQTFYRMRIGTTSQAHSEVLCQRMHAIKLSCAVLGLPGKAKTER